MRKEQLLEAKKVDATISLVEKTLERVGTTGLGWNANGYFYKFTKAELGDNDSLINIINDVAEISRILLMQKIENYKKELENKFNSI